MQLVLYSHSAMCRFLPAEETRGCALLKTSLVLYVLFREMGGVLVGVKGF